MLKSICLFLPTGRTFTFRDATITTNNETVLVFDYKAMSDDEMKTMVVRHANIVGYSFLKYIEEDLPF